MNTAKTDLLKQVGLTEHEYEVFKRHLRISECIEEINSKIQQIVMITRQLTRLIENPIDVE